MKLAIATTINGQHEDIAVNPHQTLLEFLRDELKLKGAVEGCSFIPKTTDTRSEG